MEWEGTEGRGVAAPPQTTPPRAAAGGQEVAALGVRRGAAGWRPATAAKSDGTDEELVSWSVASVAVNGRPASAVMGEDGVSTRDAFPTAALPTPTTAWLVSLLRTVTASG